MMRRLHAGSRAAYNRLRSERVGSDVKINLRILPAVALAVLLARPSFGAGTSEASGKVTDAQGNPIPDAVLTFVNAADAKATYDATTDKKGRYFVDGLLYVAPGITWKVSVKAAGFVPSKIMVESRTQTQIVAKFDANLSPDGSPHSIPIRALGKARVDFVMVPPDQAPPSAPAAGAGESERAPSAGLPKDPLGQAAERIREGDLAGSVEYFNQAIEASPGELEPRLELARVLYKLERYKEAEAQAQKAAELAPGKPGPNRILASIYYANDQYDRADAALKRERQISPDDPGVLAFVGQIAEELNRPDEAIGAYESLVAIQPDSKEAWIALGSLYAGKGDSAKSEAAYRKVTEIDPANAAQVFYNIGAVIRNKTSATPADTRKAVEAFRRAVELKPDYGAAHKELGYALLSLGELADARAALEKYLAIEPKAPDAGELRALLAGLPKKN